jgi:hypothetical protein
MKTFIINIISGVVVSVLTAAATILLMIEAGNLPY